MATVTNYVFSNQTVISAKYKTVQFHRVKFLTRWSNAHIVLKKPNDVLSCMDWVGGKLPSVWWWARKGLEQRSLWNSTQENLFPFRNFWYQLLTHSFRYSKSNSCNWSEPQVPCSGLVWCPICLFLTNKLFLRMKLFWYKGETVCQDVIIQICGCQ